MKKIGYLVISLLITGISCSKQNDGSLKKGVPLEVATQRIGDISDVNYYLYFDIPESQTGVIRGKSTVEFSVKSDNDDVVLDYAAPDSCLSGVVCNGKEIKPKIVNEHVVIPSKLLNVGRNTVQFEFSVQENTPNRYKDYLYTLFVPDKARMLFPCFDQPDLKAHFNLVLSIPSKWIAVSNAPTDSVFIRKDRKTVHFQPSDLISTYHFAFVAGKFNVINKEIDGRKYCMYHREDNERKIKQNADSIFSLVHRSICWMESYTDVIYPFKKYDLVILPSFQFSGMEQVGAVYYNASKMWLNDNPSLQDRLSRAELIAHETAHMWMGNLVTMRWFNDVWMKEVFANFFADKIVEKIYPTIDNRLRFFINHGPKAYMEDRTLGSNPIRQPLSNLNQAGSLYGNIIYHKSPFAIRSLEKLMGESRFKLAVRNFIQHYALSNASWSDLVSCFNKYSDFNLEEWSKAWIESPGIPVYEYKYEEGANVVAQFYLNQVSEQNNGLVYLQNVNVHAVAKVDRNVDICTNSLSNKIVDFEGIVKLEAVVPNANGDAYGIFLLDSKTVEWLLKNYFRINSVLERASVLISMNENVIQGKLTGDRFFALLCQILKKEKNEQIVNLALDYIQTISFYYLQDEKCIEQAENALMAGMEVSGSRRIEFLRTFSRIERSAKASAYLLELWDKEVANKKTWIPENDLQNVTLELAIRYPLKSDSLLAVMRSKLSNVDAIDRFNFVSRAVASDKKKRDAFFYSLLDVRNRKNETWVLDALKLLNHPLRSSSSRSYIRPGLGVLPEIKATGDIFFPKGWLAALFYGHKSPYAYKVVQEYRCRNAKNVEPTLMQKLLQVSDNLRRCNLEE